MPCLVSFRHSLPFHQLTVIPNSDTLVLFLNGVMPRGHVEPVFLKTLYCPFSFLLSVPVIKGLKEGDNSIFLILGQAEVTKFFLVNV